MNILLLIILIFFAGGVAKLYYISIDSKINKASINLPQLLIPFSSLVVKFNKGKTSNKIAKLIISELLGMLSFFILGLSFLNIYKTSMLLDEIAIHFTYYFIVALSLLYLAIYDLINFAIPAVFITRLVLFSVLFNFVIAISKLLIYLISEKEAFNFFKLGNIDNLLGFVVLYFLTFLLIHFTKEKAMGKGDMDVNGLVGISLGYPGFIVYLFTSLIFGGIIAIVYSLIIRKFKGILIPLVPIILLSFVFVLGYTEELIKLIFIS